jgi:hypothetical protein
MYGGGAVSLDGGIPSQATVKGLALVDFSMCGRPEPWSERFELPFGGRRTHRQSDFQGVSAL